MLLFVGVIGVSQLCNKRNGNCFTAFDEQLTEAFAIFCGLGLVQVINLNQPRTLYTLCYLLSYNQLSLLHWAVGSKAVARTKESHFIGRLVGVKLPKTADHWWWATEVPPSVCKDWAPSLILFTTNFKRGPNTAVDWSS